MGKRLYEAMFIVDAAKGGSEFASVVQHIAGLLQRHGADIERIEKWDDRKLVYSIRQVERGMYILTYFRLETDKVAELRRDVRLSENLLRVLVLAAEEMTPPRGQLYSPDGQPVAAPVDEPAAAQDAEAGS